MAERRMFAKTIIDSDSFLDMPLSTQCLYFHLSMRADDDGFINNPKKIQRMVGASEDDLKLLIAKSFIITFDTGIVVIKHWKIHNYIQSDRYKPTVYREERDMLEMKCNRAYTLVGEAMDTECIQDVSKVETQIRIDKNRLDKVNKEEKSLSDIMVFFLQYPEVLKEFEEFVKMRKQIKKPMSDHAKELALGKLKKLASSNGDFNPVIAIQIIDNSIEGSWTGLYELKDKPKGNKFTNFEGQNAYDFDALEKALTGG